MNQPSFEQTFQEGMAQDIDAHLQPANTFRDADNIRLLYNPDDTDTSDGHSLAVSNPRGSVVAASLSPGYHFLHSESTTKGILVLSSNGTNSEFGMWNWDDELINSGTYVTLYNDAYDPNLKNKPFERRSSYSQSGQDQLGFYLTDEFDMRVIAETNQTERVYFTYRRSPMYTFDLLDAYNSDGTTVHSTTIAGNKLYPKYWSTHAFRERMDLVFPYIKFVGRGKGRMLSGAYQIAIQYLARNGHESVWSPLTRRVFVTTSAINDDNVSRQNALQANHHNRVMQPSGQMSSESLLFDLENVDTRWERVRVAVVYFASDEAPYKRITLKPIELGTETTVRVEIKELQGDEITSAQLNQVYDNVLRVGTLEVSDNMLVTGDIDFLDPITIDTSQVTVEPLLYSMEADATTEATFVSQANPISGRQDGDVLTNSYIQNKTVEFSAYDGQLNIFRVNNDYANYKGQLFDWLMKGYFRGETYEYGAIAFDRSGQRMFVAPMSSFTFPEQYTPGPKGEADYYSLTKKNSVTGRYDMQVMLARLSGIAIPTEKLYDSDGRLNISGFMIVRRKRIKRLKYQGVIFPMVRTDNCYNSANRDYKITTLPTVDNSFTDQTVSEDSYKNFFQHECKRESSREFGNTYSQPYYGVLHSPDVLIEEKVDAIQEGDVLKHVGIVSSAYGKDYIDLVGDNTHRYTKSYDTSTQFPRLATLTRLGRPKLGETSRLSLLFTHNLASVEPYKEFDKDNLKLEFLPETHPNYNQLVNGVLQATRKDGLVQRLSAVTKLRDWKAVDVASVESNNIAGKHTMYRLVNYIQQAPLTSSANDPYIPVGHFQPITEEILGKVATRKDAAGKITHYVFNKIDIGGGDAYVGPFDFTRIYPYWSEGCEKSSDINTYPDYAISHIVPIESKYNLALRWGRSFAANATKPQSTSCDRNNPQFTNGISSQQPEDWKINTVLSLEEAVQFFVPKDPEQEIITDRSYGFQWSPQKSASQRIDSFRLRYTGNYGSADALLGRITKLVRSEAFSGLYVWQQYGVGVAPLNASQLQTSEIGEIIINSGRVFNGMVTLSRKFGTQHPASVWVSKGQMGAWDARNGTLVRHSQGGLDELSKVGKVDDYVTALTADLGAANLNILKQWNCVSGIDSNGDIFNSFWQGGLFKKTLIYSPLSSAFVGSLPVPAARYGRRGRYMFSVSKTSPSLLNLHHKGKRGTWYGITSDSFIRFIVNPAPTKTKRFDNGFLNINIEAFPYIKQIKHWTPNGGPEQVHTIKFPDERAEFYNNQLRYPMAEWNWDESKKDMRDHYLVVEITYDNSADVPLELISFGTAFITY